MITILTDMFLAGLGLGLVFGALVALATVYYEQIKHRIKYRRIKKPCGTCKQFGKPGYIQPQNPFLRSTMVAKDPDAEMPWFPCSNCNTGKEDTTPGYELIEWPRFKKVEFDEQGGIVYDDTRPDN